MEYYKPRMVQTTLVYNASQRCDVVLDKLNIHFI